MRIDGNTKKRTAIMLIGVAGMGIFLSFLLKVGYGTDTCSFMNAAISARTGISLGTVMVCVNSVLFIAELIWGRKYIGLGTFANMLLLGYISDFCTFLEERYLPEYIFTEQPYRVLIFAGALALFLTSAAVYMNANMGLSPFDAIPTMFSKFTHLPFFAVRMVWDFMAIGIGMLADGKVTVASIILAFTVGPAVTAVGKLMKKAGLF